MLVRGLLFFLALFGHSCAKHVVVVGAGIGGSSVAYYLRNSGHNVTVLERETRVGGRLKSVVFEGVQVDVGGDAWATSNAYMLELMRELNIPLANASAAGNGRTGLWDGRRWLPVPKGLLDEAKMVGELAFFRIVLGENYRARRGRTFRTLEEYAAFGRLDRYTARPAADMARHFSADFVFGAWDPATRGIYDQLVADASCFAALVAVLPAAETAYSARDGNDAMVKQILRAAKAQVRLGASVAKVTGTQPPYALYDAQGNVLVAQADAIVVAAPLEMARIAGLPVGNVTRRFYHHWWVTLAAADGFSPRYFGLPPTASVPDTIVTPRNSTAPFVVCYIVGQSAAKKKLYKCFSNQDIASRLNDMYAGLVSSHVQYWPQTFPELRAAAAGFQPVVLGPGLFYTSTMDSIGVAMEASVVAGRNIADLIAHQVMNQLVV